MTMTKNNDQTEETDQQEQIIDNNIKITDKQMPVSEVNSKLAEKKILNLLSKYLSQDKNLDAVYDKIIYYLLNDNNEQYKEICEKYHISESDFTQCAFNLVKDELKAYDGFLIDNYKKELILSCDDFKNIFIDNIFKTIKEMFNVNDDKLITSIINSISDNYLFNIINDLLQQLVMNNNWFNFKLLQKLMNNNIDKLKKSIICLNTADEIKNIKTEKDWIDWITSLEE